MTLPLDSKAPKGLHLGGEPNPPPPTPAGGKARQPRVRHPRGPKMGLWWGLQGAEPKGTGLEIMVWAEGSMPPAGPQMTARGWVVRKPQEEGGTQN